jgi:hypothetical protein
MSKSCVDHGQIVEIMADLLTVFDFRLPLQANVDYIYGTSIVNTFSKKNIHFV